MENIIEELIAIEDLAQNLISKTLEEQRDLTARIHSKSDEIKNGIEQETSLKIKVLYDRAHEESLEKVKQIKKDAERIRAETEEIYSENHARWEKEIYDRIIGDIG